MVDKKSKTPEVVIEQIRTAILDGLYRPGDRLLEADLAAKFHVSRSPVREALQALEGEGTLLATPYSGAMVRPLSAAEASEIGYDRVVHLTGSRAGLTLSKRGPVQSGNSRERVAAHQVCSFWFGPN